MTKDSTTTKLRDDGLRYVAKSAGSPFGSGALSRSCFRCGAHRLSAQLQAKRLLGRIEMVCKPSCDRVE